MSTKDPAGSRVFREGFGKSHPGRLAFFVGSLYSEHPMDDPTGTHLSPSAYSSSSAFSSSHISMDSLIANISSRTSGISSRTAALVLGKS